jgi:hypothetical protein
MKLYWFRNLLQDFPSWDTLYMKYDVTHILTSLKNDVKGTSVLCQNIENRYGVTYYFHSIIKKSDEKQNKYHTVRTFPKYYMLFSYQTGYIMWHSIIETVSQTRCFVMWYINVIFIKFIKFTTYETVLI